MTQTKPSLARELLKDTFHNSQVEQLIKQRNELIEALEILSDAICRNVNGMPDWLSHALDHANETMAKARGEI